MILPNEDVDRADMVPHRIDVQVSYIPVQSLRTLDHVATMTELLELGTELETWSERGQCNVCRGQYRFLSLVGGTSRTTVTSRS